MDHNKNFWSPTVHKMIDDFEKFRAKLEDKWLSKATVEISNNNQNSVFSSPNSTGNNSNSNEETFTNGGLSNNEGNLETHQEILNVNPIDDSNKSDETEKGSTLAALTNMFPDADESFLIKESQLLKDSDILTGFINNVMLNGLYPKKRKRDPFEPYDDVSIIGHFSVFSTSPSNYLHRKRKSKLALAEVIDLASDDDNCERKFKWVEEHTAVLLRIFPNVDPAYLKEECTKMDCNHNTFLKFVFSKIERNDMPRIALHHRNFEMLELVNFYSKQFDVEEFLRAIPDPWKYFSDVKRKAVNYKNHSFFT